MASLDTLLLTIAVGIIVWSFYPEQPARQQFSYDDSSGQSRQYSLAIDDPRLAKLRKEMEQWNHHSPTTALAVAKWRAETADFYARQLAKGKSQVVQVSFTDALPSAAKLQAITPADASFWSAVRDDASRIVAAEKRALQQRQESAGPPPVVFGKIVAGGRSGIGIAICGLAGLLTAIGFAIWSQASPAIRLTAAGNVPRFQQQAEACAGVHHGLRIEIPAEWIRVRQPISVTSRRMAYASLVIWAICVVLG